MLDNDAFEDGYDAYWENMNLSGNPYEEDEEGHRSWKDGWRVARKHDHDHSEG